MASTARNRPRISGIQRGDDDGAAAGWPILEGGVWTIWLAVAMAGEGTGFDHDYKALRAFYEGAVSAGGVDYATFAKRRALLDAALGEIAHADTEGWTNDQRLALYVNAYNGYTVQMMLDEGVPSSIRDLDGGDPWKARSFQVAGAALTLDAMEHQRARKLTDGRVHAVVNCASKGCPPLPPEPLRPVGIESQLDAAAKRWVASNAYTLSGGKLGLSKIFDWYGVDFGKWSSDLVPGAGSKQAAAIGFLQAFGLPADVKPTAVEWADYDWSVNRAGG